MKNRDKFEKLLDSLTALEEQREKVIELYLKHGYNPDEDCFHKIFAIDQKYNEIERKLSVC